MAKLILLIQRSVETSPTVAQDNEYAVASGFKQVELPVPVELETMLGLHQKQNNLPYTLISTNSKLKDLLALNECFLTISQPAEAPDDLVSFAYLGTLLVSVAMRSISQGNRIAVVY